MASYRRKKFAVMPVTAPNSDINMTPLIDVVLVLLIIFMVVTPLLEKDIEVKVPQTEEVETTSEVPPDQLLVNIAANGAISISTRPGVNEPVTPERYAERIKEILATKKAGDKLAFFMADDAANYGLLVSVLDQTKMAGADTLGMMTELPDVPPGGAPAPGGELGAPPPPPAPPAPPAP